MSPENKIFAFEIGQLVRLEDREGQVSARQDFGYREPEYQVQFLESKLYCTNGDLVTATRIIGERGLRNLQPPPMVSLAEAQSMVDKDRKKTVEHYLDTVRTLTGRIERMEAAKRRRKASRSARIRKRR